MLEEKAPQDNSRLGNPPPHTIISKKPLTVDGDLTTEVPSKNIRVVLATSDSNTQTVMIFKRLDSVMGVEVPELPLASKREKFVTFTDGLALGSMTFIILLTFHHRQIKLTAVLGAHLSFAAEQSILPHESRLVL